MIRGVYAIKDLKSTFWQPFCHHNDQSATREFANMVNADNVVSQNPGDFELWNLGTYDDQTGTLVSSPVFVVAATALKKVIDA